MQLFTNKGGFVRIYPIVDKSLAYSTLQRFLHEVGVPSTLMTDNAPELIQGEWKRLCKRNNVHMKFTEPHSQWKNFAESAGGYVKKNVKRLMQSTNTPMKLWDYCWEYFSEIKSNTATKNIYLGNRTPYESVMGFTPDISELIKYKWYQTMWYHEPVEKGNIKLGRWLGPAHSSGQGLACYILTNNGSVVTRLSISSLSKSDLDSPEISKNIEDLTETIINKLCDRSDTLTAEDSPEVSMDETDYNILFSSLDEGLLHMMITINRKRMI